jgi:hypothetical protein
MLNYELGQQKLLNSTLQEKITTQQNNTDMNMDEKIKLLDNKKSEILEQIEILKIKYEENDKLTQQNELIEKKIQDKHKEILELINKNINIYNNIEKLMIIENKNMTRQNEKYRYKFPNKYEWITGIEIISYSFPEILYNITENNNTLYYYTDDDNEINICKIEKGNYTIEEIIEILNTRLKEKNIEIICNKNNGIIIFRNIKEKTIILDNRYNNSILENLGYREKEYKGIEIRGNMSYDLRSDKIVQMYINNISDDAICKIYIGSERIYQIMNKLTNAIQKVEEFEIEFKDSKNRNIIFEHNFIIEISVKGICNINEIKTENNYNENELYENISKIIEI